VYVMYNFTNSHVMRTHTHCSWTVDTWNTECSLSLPEQPAATHTHTHTHTVAC